MSTSAFHPGERLAQERVGAGDAMEAIGHRVIRPRLPPSHARFLASLPWLVLGLRDAHGRPWATVLAGRPGFVTAPDPGRVLVGGSLPADDPAAAALAPGAGVGMLGIELDTRRRNRVNGRVHRVHGSGFEVEVDQVFGNCPQHIHPRVWRAASPGAGSAAERYSAVEGEPRSWVEEADTFFIASSYRGAAAGGGHGLDVSHRGGPPGFARVDDDGRIAFVDLAGNNFFNTVGNLLLDPRAALTFVRFGTGDLLQLTGRAEVEWLDAPPDEPTRVERMVRFTPEAVVVRRGALPLRWERSAS